MKNNNLFIICLGTSLLIHAGFLIILPYRAPSNQPLPKKRIIEVSYQQSLNQKQPIPDKQNFKKETSQKTDKTERTKHPLPETNTIETFVKNQISKSKEILELVKNPFVKKEEERPVKKTVNLPNIPGEIFKSPDYKNYYHIVREKIRKLAYQNYKQLQEGEVFLTFCLDPQGNLLSVEVNEEKSVKDSYLRQIAIKSVKNAAPYPDFPKKLKNQKKLSFNVIISFELK